MIEWTSFGICLDFTGDIGVDNLAFGNPTRFLQLNPKFCTRTPGNSMSSLISDMHETDSNIEDAIEENIVDYKLSDSDIWDKAVMDSSKDFEHRMHMMLCGSDCHSHVAVALNFMEYRGFRWWNKVILATWVFFFAKHTSWGAVVRTWLGPLVVFTVILATKV